MKDEQQAEQVKQAEGKADDATVQNEMPEGPVDAKEVPEQEQEKKEEATADSQVAELNRLEQELNELQNRFLRVQADFDNYRKRTRQEKEELVQYATQRLIEELLPVLDHFQMAMNVQTEDVETLKKGIDMVWRQLQQILEKQGLQKMETIGQPFDPNLHEAVMTVEATEGVAAGTVVEELRAGFKLKDRVIRAAMVKVAK